MPRALADLVDLRKQEVAKNLTFKMSNQPNSSEFIPDKFFSIANGTNPPGTGTIFQYDTSHVDYTLPVGKVVGLELYTVDYHPFHMSTSTPSSSPRAVLTRKWTGFKAATGMILC